MIADLDVLAGINKRTAAASARAYLNTDKAFYGRTRIVCVFDMGGGTTDVSIVSISSEEIRVTSTSGNDIDTALIKFIVVEIKDKHDREISQDREALFVFVSIVTK